MPDIASVNVYDMLRKARNAMRTRLSSIQAQWSLEQDDEDGLSHDQAMYEDIMANESALEKITADLPDELVKRMLLRCQNAIEAATSEGAANGYFRFAR